MNKNIKEIDYRITDNVINNQNYIISTKLKKSKIFNFLLNNNSNFFLINIIVNLIKMIFIMLINIKYIKDNRIILFLVFHFILIILFSPILYFGFFYYIFFFFYISVTIINTFNDYFLLNMYIFWFKRYTYNWDSYKDKLVETFKFKWDILWNDWISWITALIYTFVSNSIFFILLFIFKFIYA